MDRIRAKDAAWFRANPRRNNRVRYAEQAEIADAIEISKLFGGAIPDPAKWFPLYVIVHQIKPGMRLRQLAGLRKNWTNCSEAKARSLWKQGLKQAQGVIVEGRP